MSLIGEAILSVSIEMLVEKLVTKGLQLFARQEQIQADLKNWQRMLVKIKAVLDDADEKHTREPIRIWLGELQNLAYDVEDILDEFATEALRRELLNEPDQQPSGSTSSKLRKLIIPTCCSKFSPGSVKFDSMMASKVEGITLRLQEIVKQKDELELKENPAEGRSVRARKQPETTSLVVEAEVHGREEDKKAIVEMLLKDDLNSDGGFSVIPIIGMGGLGKTTLAQLAYNDEMVESHFDLKAWACVSEDFDVVKVTRTILKTISPQIDSASDDDLNSLQIKLKNGLSGKKFLIVLDDTWNEIYGDWTNLKLPFVKGEPGSKIIVTTRNKRVADVMGTVRPYNLKILSDDDCLLVFTQHCLGTRDFNTLPYLRDLGKEIMKKCNGLPLAAKTLGGLLRGKDDLRDWKKVLKNKIWEERIDVIEAGGGGGEIMRALRVSYHFLPAYLKRCFTHCALLPKDYEFREKEIVLLWMAEGLLQHSNTSDDEDMVELGRNYFQELQSRSFFQQSTIAKSFFVMHDLVNDLAQWAAKEMYCRMEDNKQKPKFSKTLRHFSYIHGGCDSISKLEAIAHAENLRTFLPIRLRDYGTGYLSYDVVHLLMKLQRLRSLSLRGYEIYEIPNLISDLKHLRHLDLSQTKLTTLPESVNTLYNLHTLLLEKCRRLKKLCSDMGNLIKLSHLNNSGSNSLEEMPLRISKLTCLKTLSYFVVGKNSGSGLEELKSLNNLKGELKISRLENVKDVEAKEAELIVKENLQALSLEWSIGSDGNLREAETETRVLDMLRPHENLKGFNIKGYGGTKFPIWFGNPRFANLVRFKFEQCNKCTSLPLLGQLPVLKHLFIFGMSSIKSVGPDFYGNSGSVAFPSLHTLRFEHMKEWKDWIPHGGCQQMEVFPQLRELFLSHCPKLLGRLPKWLPSLEKLFIRDCKQLVVVVPFTQMLCSFEIEGCKKVEGRRSTDLSLPNSLVSNDNFCKVFLRGLHQQEQLPNIEELVIHKTEELTNLWQTRSGLLQDISSLQRLTFVSCPQLVSLVAEDEEELLRQQGLPCDQSRGKLPQDLLSLCSLKEIKISKCHSLESLPQALISNYYSNTPLESLSIDHCDSLSYIASVPPRLKRLKVRYCRKLATLIYEGQVINNGYTSTLKHLYISDCPSLTSLWSRSELPASLELIGVYNCSKLAFLSRQGNLPEALKELSIQGVPELESIAVGLEHNKSLEIIKILDCQNVKVLPGDLHKADSLQQLVIGRCPNLVRFPEGGLPCKKLSELEIRGCGKLKNLPNRIHGLTSLQNLTIGGCPSIESFPETTDDIDGFGFPSNLVELVIDYNKKIFKPLLLEWGFHSRFTCIRRIFLCGVGCLDVVSFPPEDAQGIVLLTSLKILSIIDFPNLEHLSSNIGKLTSLESLYFQNCPKLQHFPENGLPTSLLELTLIGSPLMEEKCKKDKGKYWPLIAHLPRAAFGRGSAFDPFVYPV